MRLRYALCLLTVLLLSIVASVSGRTRPNVLLIVSDDQRADTIHALGNRIIETPNLDRLVRDGTTFLRATCGNPICTPSRAEILTGCSSFRNGVLDFGRKIRPALATWPRTMAEGGYHSWYVGKWHNDGKPGTHGYSGSLGFYTGGGRQWYRPQVDWKGMEVTGYRYWLFQDETGRKFPGKGVGLTPDISARFADSAIDFIRRKTNKPFFLHVNFTAPHDPLLIPPGYEDKYDPAKIPLPGNFLPRHPFDHGNIEGRDEKMLPWPREPDMVRKNLAVYYAVISHMDRQIGRILKVLDQTGQSGNTLVIFTSDHGLAVGSHGLMGKQSMYEHTIRVPLVVAGPGVPRGKRSKALCYLRDLFPTTCDLAGLPIPRGVEGRSLKPVIQGKADSVYPEIYGYFRDKQRMVRNNRWKLIHYPEADRYQLFDLGEDPDEKTDLIADKSNAGVVRKLKAKLTLKMEEWESYSSRENE
jgi:arylsulfatase A-like enzyme